MRFIQGDQEQFKAIFDAYWKRLFSYAFKIYKEEAICEDIVQEVFIQLWERTNDTEILNLESYLFRAVKYGVANRIRDLKVTEDVAQALETSTDSSLPDVVLESQEAEHKIMLLIEQLPPKCKQIFKMSRFDHKDNTTIAKELDLSVRTVETQISKALKHFKKHYPGYGVVVGCMLNYV